MLSFLRRNFLLALLLLSPGALANLESGGGASSDMIGLEFLQIAQMVPNS